MIILGIDPGLERVGWGIVESKENKLSYRTSGCIKTSRALTTTERISIIAEEIAKIVRGQKPDEAVVERLFFAKNKKTALLVSEARGAIMLTLHSLGVQTREYTPLAVKLAITGNGRAEKRQVAWVVKRVLKIDHNIGSDDELDALALCMLGGQKVIHNA